MRLMANAKKKKEYFWKKKNKKKCEIGMQNKHDKSSLVESKEEEIHDCI